MNAAPGDGRVQGLAGVWPGEQSLAARIGLRLAFLPGRWRWAIERLCRWWFAELAGMNPLRRTGAAPARAVVVGQADLLDFSLMLSPEQIGLVEERIALTIEARTPFEIGEVMAAYRLESKGAEIRATVWLTPIERLARLWPEDGAEAVLLAGEAGLPMTVPVPLEMLEPDERRSRIRAARRGQAVAAAVVVGALAMLVVPLLARREAVAQAQAALEQERAVMAPLIRRAAQGRALERAAAKAVALKQERTSPLAVLDHLTRGIGDDSYLTEFRLAGDEGAMGGFTTQAAALPEPLEGDPLLGNVRLTGPVSRNAQNGRQRFEIAFEVAP